MVMHVLTVKIIVEIYTSYAMLSSGIPWNMPRVTCIFRIFRAFRRVCIQRKYKSQVACSTVSHEKALHNYFIPCLNLRKTYGNFGKSSENSANFRKLRKCSEIFGNFRKTFGNGSKVIFRCFYDFSKFSENLRKSSETISGCYRKC